MAKVVYTTNELLTDDEHARSFALAQRVSEIIIEEDSLIVALHAVERVMSAMLRTVKEVLGDDVKVTVDSERLPPSA